MHFQNLNTKNEPIQYSYLPASQNPHTLNFDSAAQTPQEQFLNRTGGSLGHMPANQSLTGGYNYQTPTFPPNPPPEFNVNAPQGPVPMAFPATNFYIQPQNHNVSQNSHYSHQYTNMHPQFWSPGYQQSHYSGMYPNSFFGQNYWPAPPVMQHYPIHGSEYAGNFPSNPNNSMISVSSSMAGHQQIPPYPQTQNFMHFQAPPQQPFLGHYLPQNQGNYNLWNPAQNSFMNNSGFGNQLPHWHQNNQNFSSRVINIPTESKHEESVRASSCQEIGVDQIRLENHKFFQTKSENLLVDLLEDLQENKEQADELSQPKMPENFAKDRRNSFSNFPCLKYDKNQICQIIRYTEVSEQGVLNGKHFVSEFEILKFSSLLQMGAECQVARIDKMEGIQIDFETLAKFNVRFLGIFGRLNLILQALADNKLIEKSEIQDFGQHFTDAGTGLFAIPLKVEADETLVLLVLYTAEEDDLNAISDRRGFVRMLRYLTQLCNSNIMCLDRSDLDKIIFQKEGKQARHTRFIPQINQIVNDSCTLGKKNEISTLGRQIELNLNSTGCIFYEKTIVHAKKEEKKKIYHLKSFSNFKSLLGGKSSKVAEPENFSLDDLEQAFKTLCPDDYEKMKSQVEKLKNEEFDELCQKIREKHNSQIVNEFIDLCAVKAIELNYPHLAKALKSQNEKLPEEIRSRLAKTESVKIEINKNSSDNNTLICKNIFQKTVWKHEIHGIRVLQSKKPDVKVVKELLPKLEKNLESNPLFPDNYDKKRDALLPILEAFYPRGIFSGTKFSTFLLEIQKEGQNSLGSINGQEIISHDGIKIFMLLSQTILKNKQDLINNTISKEIDELSKKFKSEKAKNFYYEQFKSKFEIQREQEIIKIFQIEIKKYRPLCYSWEVYLHYSEMEEIKEETIYRLFRAEVSKDDLQKYSENQTVVLRPKLSEVGKIQQDSLAKVVQFLPVKNHKMGVLLNRDLRTEIEFHNLNNCREAVQKGGQFGKPTAKSDYNEQLRRFLVLRKSENELDIFIYSLDDNLAHRSEGKLDLRSRFGIDDVICFRSAPNGDIVILADDRRVWRIDPRTSEGKKMGIHLDDVENLLIIPDSECLLLLGQNRIVPYIMETSTRLLELPIDYRFDPAQAIVVQFSSQVHLIFKVEGRIYTQVLDCCLNNQMYSLVSRSRQDLKSSETSTLSILDYFSIMYTRFSILDPMGHSRKSHSQILMAYIEKNQFFEEDVKKIERKLAEIGSKIQKPGSSDLGLARNLKILPMGQNNSSTLFERSEPQRLDGWMQELVCFVPVQIARSENNNLILMKDGSPLAYDDCDNAYDLQQRISFGLYETLFRNWNKSIKVVTSMGKQSTGKSYTLNHLSGASFDIAAGRCTDGCWMTVKVTDDCLYVMMDFEGLGTFERSEQEDMLLSIFNASISSITLFKTDFSLGRDTNEMFNRFNQGVNLLKGNERIFSGIFCIIVKDVRESDTKGIIEEFKEKINAVIKREKKKDFITMMFKGGFDVYPFPSLDLPAYYQETEELKNYIQNEVPAMFDNGTQFLELMKTILAKIAIQDFTSLSRKDVDLRVHNLNRFLENVITFGTLADTKTNCPDFILKSFDRKGQIVSPDVHFELEFGTEKTLDVQYQDFDLIFEISTESLVRKFSEFVKIDPQNFRNWNAAFRKFTDQAVRQRMSRVLNWIQINIEKWSEVAEFKDQLRQFQTNVNQKLREFQSKYRICQNQCDVCFNFCILLGYHQGNHHCALSDHKCPKFCQYCESDQESETCNLNFGHQEPHKCRDKPHTCREICRYVKCEGTCSSISGHEGQHVCGKSFHNCPEICSLPHCRARCQISADRQHTAHKCVSDSCTAKCGIKGCTVRCVCNDHFHKMPELSDRFKIENEIEGSSVGFETEKGKFEDLDFHFCGNDHGCPEECLDDGFCQVIVERRVTQERFEGRRDQFEYTKKFENIGSKLRCCEKIPAFQTTHPGRHVHTHDSSFIHQCTVRCPTCNNICDKQFGHPGRHNTAHGNMDNCYFVANQDDIDIGDHKYVVGEPSVAEMCHMFCKKLGRGHIHVLPCGKTKEACTPQDSEHKRHQKIEYGPDPENSKDEVHHDEYWKIINFEDPCQVIDIDDFKKCPFYCGSTEHNKDAEKRFCQLDLWHEKVQNLAQINKKNGYVSTDGHYFSCSHESFSKGFHFYFCLDDSGSMQGIPWSDIVQAMKQFCKSRRQSLTDRLSIVQFDSAPLTMCEDIGFDEFHSESYLQFRGGGTCFGLAISHCYQLMKKVHQKDLTPVFIFMSDGGAHDGDSELLQLYQDFSGQGLKSFFIAFGSVQKKLSSLAGLCGGTYSTSLTGLDLKSNFLSISSKFGTTVSVVRSKI